MEGSDYMKIYKFRAWDAYDKKMHHHTEFENFRWLWGKNEDIVVMQWIGLVDKDGNDIYEGDIVEWKQKGKIEERGIILWDKKTCRFLIRNQNGFEVGSPFDLGFLDIYYQIIGNIYETPELIPKAQLKTINNKL